jgi:hypothetical protein
MYLANLVLLISSLANLSIAFVVTAREKALTHAKSAELR